MVAGRRSVIESPPRPQWYEGLNDDEVRLLRTIISKIRTVKNPYVLEIRWSQRQWDVFHVQREKMMEVMTNKV